MLQEHVVAVDHSTINQWVLKYVPQREHAFCGRKRHVSTSWWLDETYRYCWRMVQNHPKSLICRGHFRRKNAGCVSSPTVSLHQRQRAVEVPLSAVDKAGKTVDSQPSGTAYPPSVSWRKRFAATVCPRRSPSIRVRPTPPSSATMPSTD